MNQAERQNDIPASVALVALLALFGAWIYFRAPSTVAVALNELDRYAEVHLTTLAVLLFSTTINFIWFYSVCSRFLGINRQGQRLQILMKDDLKNRKPRERFPWGALALSIAITPLLYLYVKLSAIALLPSFVPKRFLGPTWAVVALDLGFSLFVILGVASRVGWLEKLFGNKGQRLSEMPELKNALVLGSVEEIEISV